jgi:predicted AlkP superfamily phosphohydrolase/phosphomutase
MGSILFAAPFDTNTWLWQNGLLALKDGRKPKEDMGEGFAAVDWSRTYAYAAVLGGIYLNFKGREREGVWKKEPRQRECVTRFKAGWRALRMRRRSGRRCAACRAGKT